MPSTVGEQMSVPHGASTPIVRVATATVALVGRALRGPLNQPVLVRSFADYQSVFGNLWQPSALSYAVEQFFDNGGELARVVRVANGARSVTLHLPAGSGQSLRLEARCPGTREFLRASVDYDNIPVADTDAFNLVVHRVRAPGSEYVEDQEIYARASVAPQSPRHIGVLLAESSLVRLIGDMPTNRPTPTERGDLKSFAAYVCSNPDGDDGAPISDYDLIGSAVDRTGLFALGEQDPFNFLYLPGLNRDTPAGASSLLVAARLCRARRALLVVDPPADWTTPTTALAGVRETPYASDQTVMYYPWLQAYDRLRGRVEHFPPSAAALGMLSRLSAGREPWRPGVDEAAPLRPGFRPACIVDEEQRTKLASAGLNVLQSARARRPLPARTLGGARATVTEWRYLSRRRLALQLVTSIVEGTRWAAGERSSPAVWRRLERQVGVFLAGYERDDAFPATAPGSHWFVVCDDRLNTEPQDGVRVLFGYTTGREGTWICWLLRQSSSGADVQSSTLSQLQSAGGRPPLDPDFDVGTLLQEQFRA